MRELVQRQLASGIHGRLYVGRISGSFLNGITIDSLEIRDPEDSVFVSTGRVSVAYDPRDLMDKRVLIQRVDVEHPFVHLRQHENWQWNFREVFAGGGPSGPRTPGTHFGDFVVLDSVHVRDATFMLTLPWHPDDSLRAARRDSAIRFELSRPDKEIRRRRDGFARTWRWTQVSAVLPRVRLSDPDSAGRTFAIDTLAADERDPPFSFRNVRGTLRNLGDSIWVDVAHFDLPGSTGKGRGKIWWGSDLPVRYALHIIGDSVSLADVHWVYPTLPAKGGGSMLLDIENEKDLNIMDYRLTNMDVRAARSHLKGDMTFAVGGPVLAVKDVKLTADPVDFELLRTLNGKPFPVDWQGAATGTVRARGGPLTDFVVDDAALTFRDAHVPGAVSQVAGDGGLDILNPAFTAFHGFNVRAQRVDLRTIEYLYPNFPRLGGFISGTATLDSSWLDVRFSDADVTHSDGDAPPSRITGDGRVTYGEQFMRYDLDVQADSLSLTDLRQSYPKLPFRGMVAGPVRVQGTLDSLQLDASLSGPAGSLTFAGMLDAFPADVGAHGRGRFAGLDVAQLLARDSIPAGSLTGAYTVDVQGDSLTTMHGTATLALDRSTFDRVRIFPSRAHVRLADARVHVDTLEVESSAGALSMTGALGLRADTRDSLRYIAIADSLGGLRPFLETRTAQLTGHPDSLAGTISVSGVVSGSIDTIDVSGTALGTSVYMNKDRGRSLRGSLALHDVLREPRGVVAIELDTLVLAGIRVDTIGARVRLAGRRAGHFELGTLTDNGVSFGADGRLSLDSGATNLVVEHVALNAGGDT
ncbi:MAG TPA: hypothetical protein VG818_04830, partial [Gemmatimonadaceae bacterium]|nr:hypothetical protein [Gemmatimonadaceae bacterium]